MKVYAKRIKMLKQKPKTWLVTGVAGFIGSNILEELLKLDQSVIGLDNFVTGSQQLTKLNWLLILFLMSKSNVFTNINVSC